MRTRERWNKLPLALLSLSTLRVCRCFFPSLFLRWCFVVIVVAVSLRTLSDRWISFSKASLRSLGSEGLFSLFTFSLLIWSQSIMRSVYGCNNASVVMLSLQAEIVRVWSFVLVPRIWIFLFLI
jgi:hypothetical protein